MTRKRIYELPCPIANALDVIGDRWTLLILRDLFLRRHRYSELQESLDGIPPTLLTERLRLLETEGVITRRIYSDSPLRADYALTTKGRELAEVMNALAHWGQRHYPSEDGTAYRMTHERCGGVVETASHCDTCGDEVKAEVMVLDRRSSGHRSKA